MHIHTLMALLMVCVYVCVCHRNTQVEGLTLHMQNIVCVLQVHKDIKSTDLLFFSVAHFSVRSSYVCSPLCSAYVNETQM